MADMMDYIKWRGDIPFDVSPFNDVDALILCQLAYADLDGIVLPDPAAEPLSIALASDMFVNSSDYNERRDLGTLISSRTNDLLPLMAKSERYKNYTLSCYVDEVDSASQQQFSAICIGLGNNDSFIAFRGTDGTIVGWKEDFNMSFSTVPSQLEAVKYVEKIAAVTEGDLLIGGHSKGGNLAVYAAAFCNDKVRDRIKCVYNNDGPGFVDSVIRSDEYNEAVDKMRKFVPQSSVIGMLLGQSDKYTVVRSVQKGIMQHDAFSWQVERDGMEQLDSITDGSLFVDNTLKDWISNMDDKQKSQFVDVLFGAFEFTDIESVSDFSIDRLKRSSGILKYLGTMDDATRKVIVMSLRKLVDSVKLTIAAENAKKKGSFVNT